MIASCRCQLGLFSLAIRFLSQGKGDGVQKQPWSLPCDSSLKIWKSPWLAHQGIHQLEQIKLRCSSLKGNQRKIYQQRHIHVAVDHVGLDLRAVGVARQSWSNASSTDSSWEWGDAQAEDNEDAIMTPTVNAEEANTCHSQHESVFKRDATIDPTSNATGHNRSAVVVQVKYRFCFFVKHLASSE